MRFQNNPILQEMLVRGGAAPHLATPEFELDQEAFANCKAEVERQHPEHSPEEIEARTVYRMLTLGNPLPAVAQPVIEPQPSLRQRLLSWLKVWGPKAWPWIKLLWALAVLGLLIALAAKAEPSPQPQNMAQKDALVRAALRSPVFAQATGIIIQLQNQGSVLATRPAGLLVFNCGSNMTCSFSGSTFTLGASGTLGTAFNNLTSGTNTGATMTVGTGAALNFSGSGSINATQIQGVSMTGTPAAGQIPIASSGTAAAWGDPIVSGPDAPGVAPTRNPVQMGSFDGTNVQRVSSDTSGKLNVNVSNTPNVSISAALPAGSNAIGTVTANAGTGNFNNASVGSTGGAAPGSATQAGCAFNSTLPSLTTGQMGAAQCDSSARKIVVGAGTAGTPAGGVVSVQGVASGTALPVSGTVTANAGTGNFNNASVGSTGSAVPSWASYVGGTDGTNLVGFYLDPCKRGAKTRFTINLTASGQIITGTANKKTYICDFDIVTATAQNIALVEGTGTTCATGIAGMAGGTTAATGWNFAANGGLTKGNGDASVFSADSAAGDNVCLLLSGTGQTSGSGHYAQF